MTRRKSQTTIIRNLRALAKEVIAGRDLTFNVHSGGAYATIEILKGTELLVTETLNVAGMAKEEDQQTPQQIIKQRLADKLTIALS